MFGGGCGQETEWVTNRTEEAFQGNGLAQVKAESWKEQDMLLGCDWVMIAWSQFPGKRGIWKSECGWTVGGLQSQV